MQQNSDFIGKTYTLISVSDSWIASLHRIEYVFCVPFPGALPLQYRPVSPFLSIIKYTLQVVCRTFYQNYANIASCLFVFFKVWRTGLKKY